LRFRLFAIRFFPLGARRYPCRTGDFIRQQDSRPHGPYVMHPHDVSAVENSRSDCCRRGKECFFFRTLGED
jgi:hypothetical protein